MSSPATARDELLGGALRELAVPEHRPGFHARLHHLLAEERQARGVQESGRSRTRGRRVAWAVRLAAAAAIVTAVLVVGLPESERLPTTGPSVANAAQVKARVRAALAGLESVSGELVVDGSERGDLMRWRFALTQRGDYRITGITHPEDRAYDAERNVERAWARDYGETFGGEHRGLAPAPPDPSPLDWVVERDFGAVVRALLAANDPRVVETTYAGRPAWKLDVPVSPNLIDVDWGTSEDRFVITVDQETGFPIEILSTFEGRFAGELRIEDLTTNPELSQELFTISLPPGADTEVVDHGFRRVRLDQVRDAVGYRPLVPTFVPDGFELVETSVAREAPQTGVEGMNPKSMGVVSLLYRRGLEELSVTTRLRHVAGYGNEWSDPLGTGEGFHDEPENITLEAGALAGVNAALLIVPRNVPHLWALTDELVVTVSGDLSRAELISTAESLQSHE